MKKINLSKIAIFFLILLSAAVGAGGCYLALNPGIIGIATGKSNVTISSDQYDYYRTLEYKYGDADDVWNKLDTQYYTSVDDRALKDSMLKGLVDGLGDQYSSYLTDEEYQSRLVSVSGKYQGVGIVITFDDNGPYALRTIKNSPAAKGGVQSGDRILKVDGVSVDDMDINTVAEKIRGEEGTQVTVTFRLKDDSIVDRTFTRQTLQSDTVSYKMLDNNIGYIELSSFDEGSATAVKDALNELQNADSLIFDLRSNPGGLVSAAQEIADMFMDKATLVYTEDHDGNREYLTTSAGRIWTKPVVILIDGNSASASEILTAGLKDNGIVTVIGTQSFGKGIIQEMEPLSGGGALQLTKWQYFSPSGTAIHGVGITPDIEVELQESDFDENGKLVNDEQLSRAIEELSK